MTKEQLEALIDQVFTNNGVGSITGTNANAVLKAIVSELFDQVGGEAAIPDDASVEHNQSGKLSVKLAAWPIAGYTQAAQVVRYNKSGAYTGLYLAVDGVTIFENDQHQLCVVSGGGGGGGGIGTNPNTIYVADSFNDFMVAGETNNAYLSDASVNGYLKLDTGAQIGTASWVRNDIEVSMDSRPRLNFLFKLGSLTDVIAKAGLSEITTKLPTGAGIMFVFDPDVDDYWHCVITDGGENTIDLATLVLADTDEHAFSIHVVPDPDGTSTVPVVTWFIDGVEIASSATINLADTLMKLFVAVESTAAASKVIEMDLYNLLAERVTETGVTYFATPAVNAPKQFIFFITQSGTAAPTLDILQSGIGQPTTSYVGVGVFRIIKAGAFPAGKTIPNDVIDIATDVDGNTITLQWIDEDTMEYKTYDTNGDPSNGILNGRHGCITIF